MTQMKAENDIAAVAIAHVGGDTGMLGTGPRQTPDGFNDPVAQTSPWTVRVGGQGEQVDGLEWRQGIGVDAGTRGDSRDGWAKGRKEKDGRKNTHRGREGGRGRCQSRVECGCVRKIGKNGGVKVEE